MGASSIRRREPRLAYWWTNIAAPMSEGTRVLSPAEYSIEHIWPGNNLGRCDFPQDGLGRVVSGQLGERDVGVLPGAVGAAAVHRLGRPRRVWSRANQHARDGWPKVLLFRQRRRRAELDGLSGPAGRGEISRNPERHRADAEPALRACAGRGARMDRGVRAGAARSGQGARCRLRVGCCACGRALDAAFRPTSWRGSMRSCASRRGCRSTLAIRRARRGARGRSGCSAEQLADGPRLRRRWLRPTVGTTSRAA